MLVRRKTQEKGRKRVKRKRKEKLQTLEKMSAIKQFFKEVTYYWSGKKMKIDIGIRITTRDITLFVSGIPFPSPGSYSGSISAKVTRAFS